LGDYQGIPLNDAGRRKADSHDHSEWSLPEFQCRPHSAPYQWRALGSVRFWNEVDPIGRDLRAIHVEYLRSLDRVIYMDGRPDPVWLEEPLIQTTNYALDTHTALTYYPCTVSEENISSAVPHFLPGSTEQLKDAAGWIPPQAARGGAESTYPAYREKLKAAAK